MKSGLSNIIDDDIHTAIIGADPDNQRYRNFVSLDTRSREIRNKRQTHNNLPKVTNKTTDTDKANLIIRAYKTSVGTEYFISFEDTL